ncbi:hypothetical protein [Alteromonas phage PB15]|nr:hypothetical protein [Alteromonas phage PB15]
MKAFILVALVAILAFAAIKFSTKTPQEEAFYTALDNFVYMAEPSGVDRHYRYTTHKRKFIGDCEDFAFTLQSAIGGEVWVVEHDEVSYHAVLLHDDIVYDNFHQQPIKKANYPTNFIKPLIFSGKVINNKP